MRLAFFPSALHPACGTALAALAASLVAACGSDPTGSITASPVVGVYTLRTINGSSLPASYQSSSAVTTVLVDTLRLAATGTYTEYALTRTAPPGQAATKTDTTQLTGSYVDAGTTIGFGARGNATLSGGDTLTFVGASQAAGGGSITTVYVK